MPYESAFGNKLHNISKKYSWLIGAKEGYTASGRIGELCYFAPHLLTPLLLGYIVDVAFYPFEQEWQHCKRMYKAETKGNMRVSWVDVSYRDLLVMFILILLTALIILPISRVIYYWRKFWDWF